MLMISKLDLFWILLFSKKSINSEIRISWPKIRTKSANLPSEIDAKINNPAHKIKPSTAPFKIAGSFLNLPKRNAIKSQKPAYPKKKLK